MNHLTGITILSWERLLGDFGVALAILAACVYVAEKLTRKKRAAR